MSRTVGVIGGMGPAATVDFLHRLLAATPAERDQDHLRVLVDNNPKLPNRNAAIAGAAPSPAPELAAMARGLQAQGADFLVMPCNTAHAFAEAITDAVHIPLLSLIDAGADAAAASASAARSVGLLAADGCLDAGLYQDALASRGLTAVVLDRAERDRFMATVYRIKAGDLGPQVRAEMQALADRLGSRGAEVVLAACTEVPLVLGRGDTALPLVDATDALVARTVAYAVGPP